MSEAQYSHLASGQLSFLPGRRLVWFSCGAASAVTAKLAVEKYDSVEVIYCDTMADEHEDNGRFFDEVQSWISHPIKRLQSSKYSTVDEVFATEKYMAGIGGARCTTELKKAPRIDYQNPEDTHFFGFTADEQKRIADFEFNNMDLNLEWILRDQGIQKSDCFRILQEAGIALPAMYLLGYRNNNCQGCVKATSPGYWNKVRRDFPEVFAARAARSRELGCRLTRVKGERIFLDELPEGVGKYRGEEDLSCGPACNPPSEEVSP